jgi:predicted ATPase
LVGRDVEVAELEALLRKRRLVTLTGVGGVGKTRMALEVAARLAGEFADGVWVFELAAVLDPAAVPDAVATALGITQQPGKSVGESVAAALEGRVRLLVFDNCEHVLNPAADLVEGILERSATVTILATSREGLGVTDEQLWPVPSLDVDAGVDSAAVDLFVERAGSVVPRFSLADADEAGAVVEICRRLDGIPLAIELAASRLASMTAGEVRDRLDHRFRLLVGLRRGLERHQTLRHAVTWSYDLLDDAEKTLLDRCSVFAGGFDLQSACAVAGSDDDDYAVLDRLDTLVRKSLVVVDKSSGCTRFSMLETIRQFAEEQLVASGAATEAREAHSRYFAERESDILALWDSPRQREAYEWLTAELANLRTAFRWAADHDDLDTAATIASFVGFLAYLVENYEPTAWAEELIEQARTVDHPRLAALYVIAAQCFSVGRVEDAVHYSDTGQIVLGRSRDALPYGADGLLGAAYIFIGEPEQWIEVCRAQLVRDRDSTVHIRACLVFALAYAGRDEEAMVAAQGLIDDAEATGNPYGLSYCLLADGVAFRVADPVRALDAFRRGLLIAQDSGSRWSELAFNLACHAAIHGDTASAFDHITLALRNYHESGNTSMMRGPLAILAAVLHRLGRHEGAATVAGCALSSGTALAFPEIIDAIAHLRDILGEPTYQSLARKGETMTTSAMATYAYDQIDQARAELNGVSK